MNTKMFVRISVVLALVVLVAFIVRRDRQNETVVSESQSELVAEAQQSPHTRTGIESRSRAEIAVRPVAEAEVLPESFTPFPEVLKPYASNIIAFNESRRRVGALQPDLSAPTNEVPRVTDASNDADVSANHDAALAQTDALAKWGAELGAKLDVLEPELKAVKTERKTLYEKMGHENWLVYQQWAKAETLARVLASSSISDQERSSTAIFLAESWRNLRPYDEIEPEAQKRIGAEYPLLKGHIQAVWPAGP